MEDMNGAAPAAAAPISTPEATVETPVSPPNPVHSEPVAEPAKVEAPAKKAPSIDEALDKATKAVETQAKAEKPADKAEQVKAETKRDETGKFAPKEGAEKPAETVEAKAATEQPAKVAAPRSEAPSRFSPDAKAEWDNAPESVRAETQRAIREMEEGHQKYKASHEAYEVLKPFAERAKQGGTDLNTALTKYVGMEDALRANPIAGLNSIMENLGLKTSDGRMLTLRDVAAHVMGQTPDQVQRGYEATISELKNELAQLKQTVGGVTKTFEDQRTNATLTQVQAFAKEHPRFDEVANDVAFFLQSGRTSDLSEAYALAERLNPAPASTTDTVASSAPAPAPIAQTDKGSKSIAGAPSPGSNPALRKVSKSIDESLDRAFAARG